MEFRSAPRVFLFYCSYYAGEMGGSYTDCPSHFPHFDRAPFSAELNPAFSHIYATRSIGSDPITAPLRNRRHGAKRADSLIGHRPPSPVNAIPTRYRRYFIPAYPADREGAQERGRFSSLYAHCRAVASPAPVANLRPNPLFTLGNLGVIHTTVKAYAQAKAPAPLPYVLFRRTSYIFYTMSP